MTVYLNKKIKDNGMLTDKEALFDEVQALYETANKKCFIEPTNIKKYTGSIAASAKGRFTVNIRHKKIDKPIIAKFNNYADAFSFIKATNTEYGLPIRNKIRDHGIYMKVAMTKNRKMIFDHRNLHVVQQHTIHALKNSSTGDFYACTQALNEDSESLVTTMVHNLIAHHTRADIITGITIDHVNRNTEDNREFNLRPVTRNIQTINRDFRSDNKTGYKGVFYSHTANTHYYEAYYKENGKQYRKCFAIKKYGHDHAKQMAIDCRKQFEAMSTPYKEANRTNIIGIDMDETDMYDTTDDVEYDFESILF